MSINDLVQQPRVKIKLVLTKTPFSHIICYFSFSKYQKLYLSLTHTKYKPRIRETLENLSYINQWEFLMFLNKSPVSVL